MQYFSASDFIDDDVATIAKILDAKEYHYHDNFNVGILEQCRILVSKSYINYFYNLFMSRKISC